MIKKPVLFDRWGMSLLFFFQIASSAIAQSPTITTYVGPPLPETGQPALTQALDAPAAVVADGAGGFYVASVAQNRVYRVAADGRLTVIAGSSYGFGGDGGQATSAQLAGPSGLTSDAQGNLYISDAGNHRVRKVIMNGVFGSNGVIVTVAGNGTAGFSGDGGSATSAQLQSPSGLAIDTMANLYIVDSGNRRVRKVSSAGVISTVAGAGELGLMDDGIPATSARLVGPHGVAVDPVGNIYIADFFTVRGVSANGMISTVVPRRGLGRFGLGCESAGDGGPASLGSVCLPSDVALDASGNLYIADQLTQSIRRVTTNGIITTIAGNGQIAFAGDAGLAVVASLNNPSGVAADAGGNLYIADTGNNRVRKVTVDGVINTVSSNGVAGFAGDGGQSRAALINQPFGVTADRRGNLYVADTLNNRVRKVTTDGVITTVAGNGFGGFAGDGGLATSAQLNGPRDVAVDGRDNLYIADTRNSRIRKVTPAGTISTIAGGCSCSFGDTGPATSFNVQPRGLAVDREGNLYVADFSSNLQRIRKVTPDGTISTVAGTTEGFSGDDGPAVSAQLNDPESIAVDADGNLYIADTENSRIRKVTNDGVIHTIAGTGASGLTGDGGPAISAMIGYPSGIAVDVVGNLYIATPSHHLIRKVSNAGIISTVAGNRLVGFSGDGGPAPSARLSQPSDVAVDVAGNLYIADTLNNRIRMVSSYAAVQPYTIPNSGVNYWTAASVSAPTEVGFGHIKPVQGSTAPNGVAIFSYRSNGVLVSETAVPASALVQSGRLFAESNGPVRTGIAIANPNDQDATVSFYFTDRDGNSLNAGTTVIGAHQQLASFLDEAPFFSSVRARSFTFMSSLPVGATALRGYVNERADFLMTTLPVAGLSANRVASIVLPHFAAGGGWTTEILLVNPTEEFLTGTVEMDTTYSYTIAPRSAEKIVSSNSNPSIRTGVVRIVPSTTSGSPIASSVFRYVSQSVTVTETGVAPTGIGQSFGVFAEIDAAYSLQTGIAIANTAATAATVQFDLRDLNGQATGFSGSTIINGNGHVALFLSEIPGFQNLPRYFRGVLRILSNAAISTIGLRSRYNERGEFLVSTTPAIADNLTVNVQDLFFPHIVTGSGYTTELVLMSTGSSPNGSPLGGSVVFTSQSGTDLLLQLIR